MKVLQTSPFPLGYRAVSQQYSEIAKRFQPEASPPEQCFTAEIIRVRVSERIRSTAFRKAETWLDFSGLQLASSQLA